MSYANKLQCKECGYTYPLTRRTACDNCFGPVEVIYDYNAIAESLTPDKIRKRERSLWRYKELLPVKNKQHRFDFHAGNTPLRKCKSLGELLGLKNLYIKDDGVNPTGSFKDRPITVAVSKALEWGISVLGCASTGNLASATAAAAAKANLECYVFVPKNLDSGKIIPALVYGAKTIAVNGTYDEVNRLSNFVADEKGWGIANVNLRPYYVEGSKTIAFEIAEQLKWNLPDQVIVPLGSGALLEASHKAFAELQLVGLTNADLPKISGTQPENCAPIVNALNSSAKEIIPVQNPKTVAKSLAIGDPASGYEAINTIQSTSGWGDSPSEQEIIDGQLLLAKSEGIFGEQTAGCVIASLKRKLDDGQIDRDETTVAYVTGNGLKTVDTLVPHIQAPISVETNYSEIQKALTTSQRQQEVFSWL